MILYLPEPQNIYLVLNILLSQISRFRWAPKTLKIGIGHYTTNTNNVRIIGDGGGWHFNFVGSSRYIQNFVGGVDLSEFFNIW